MHAYAPDGLEVAFVLVTLTVRDALYEPQILIERVADTRASALPTEFPDTTGSESVLAHTRSP